MARMLCLLLAIAVPTATVVADESEDPVNNNRQVVFDGAEPDESEMDGEFQDESSDFPVQGVSIAQSPSGYGAPAPSKPPTRAKPNASPNPATTAYKGVFYDNDFRYLNDPQNQDIYLGDLLKQLSTTRNSVLDLGGEYRLRDHHEFFMRNSGPVGSNLKGLSDDFLLQRERLYVNWRLGDRFRFYGESINATSSFNRDTPRNIEVNPWDALNLFAEGMLIDASRGEVWFRAGRQELLFGNERLISPLDWANTRRTFDGVRSYWKGKDWNVDAFWTQPVLFGQHIVGSTGPTTGNITSTFDHSDSGQQFMGAYATCKAVENHTFDYYYLRYTESKAPNKENPIFAKNFDANTFGTRVLGRRNAWANERNSWLYEVEGGYQFGSYGAGNQSAGFYVLGGGYEFTPRPWKPTLWIYYDWASGNANPHSPNHGTFIQMFPLSHKYFGFMDLVARQNIRDLNFLLTSTPTAKLKLLTWFHVFELDQAKDSLYNAQGLAIRTDPTGRAGRNVGQEIDLTAQYQINPRADVLFGYSHFFAGSFITATNPKGVSGNADFYYSQWSYRF
jgi:hypothetical protein